MAKKNKRRLTEDQKRWLQKLKNYVNSPPFRWTGDQDLKEVIEGKYVVFHSDVSSDGKGGYLYEEDEWDVYNIVVGTDTYEEAECVAKWNPSPRLLIVELEACEVLKDVKKPW
jgi:hypothetical protein